MQSFQTTCSTPRRQYGYNSAENTSYLYIIITYRQCDLVVGIPNVSINSLRHGGLQYGPSRCRQ